MGYCNKTSPLFAFLLILLVVMFASDTCAAPSLEFSHEEEVWLKQHPVLTYGIDPEYAPFEFEGEQGIHRGMTADYLRRLEQLTGIRFERVQAQTWSEVLDSLRNGAIDVVFSLVYTEERARNIAFSEPFITYPTVIVTRTEAPFLTGVDELNGKVTAVVHDYYLNDLIRVAQPKAIPLERPTVRDAIDAVRKENAYAYVGNLATTSWIIRSEGWTDLKIAARLPNYPMELSVGVRKDYEIFARIVDKAFATVGQGEQDEIFQRWISYSQPTGLSWDDLRPWFLYGGLGLLMLVGVLFWRHLELAAYSRKLQREITERREAEREKQEVIERLEEALANVKTLTGLIPICAHCKKIRDDSGYWKRLEEYILQHSEAELSHGICPDCRDEVLSDFESRNGDLFKDL
jgi:two-component system sensor histidine kinase EvgS